MCAGKNHWDARTCFDSEPESIDLAMSSHSAVACRLCGICMLTLTGCHTGADVEEGHWALSVMCEKQQVVDLNGVLNRELLLVYSWIQCN